MKKEDKLGILETRQHARKRKQKRVRNWIIGILAVVCAIAAGVGLYAAHLYKTAEQAANKAYDSENAVKTTYGEFNGKKPFAVMLLGTDTGALDRTEKRGNTDTIIVVVVNPKKKNYTMISIPRDTMADMVGDDSNDVQKINAAYSIGGAKMAMQTVSNLLNIPVKYYALVNMGGLMKLVDYVGGIYVTPPLTFTYIGFPFKKGVRQHLNGQAALAYSRMRYDDPKGDYGRQMRQRQIIQAVLKKALSVNGLANYQKLLKIFAKYVKTDLTFGDMTSLALNYRGAARNVTSGYIQGHDAMISGTSFQIASTEELQKWSDKLRKSLGLATQTLANQETRQNSLNESYNGIDFSKSDTFTDYTIYEANSNTPRSSDSW